MSGNPFRRKESVTTSADNDINRSSERFPALSIDASTARSSPKPKTVRIASPEVPTSPYSAYYFSDSAPSSPELSRHPTRSESPPARQEEKNSNYESIPVDPFNADGSEDDEEAPIEVAETAGLNIHSTLPTPAAPSKHHGTKESVDPIRSTLSRFASRPNHPPQLDLNAKPTARQTMDVDAFKTLLLTGTAGKPSQQPPASADSATSYQPPPPIHASDSSSNTDTASISRASIFEPSLSNPPLSPDTPRSSHELSLEDADDERSRLVGSDATSLEPRKKSAPPPAPKTKHGKRIRSEPLQTQVMQSQSQIPPTPPAKGSPPSAANLNKPLPQPPYQDPWATVRTPTKETSAEEIASPLSPANVVKRPPTPPLTRRKSQRSSTGQTETQSQSQSQSQSQNVSRSSSIRIPSDSSSITSPLYVSKPPPAPPTRRSTSHRTSAELRPSPSSTSSDTSFSNTATSPPAPSSSFAAAETDAPNTPYSRRPSLPLSLPPNRQPSTSTLASISTSATSASNSRSKYGAAPPAPPPPRRARGSSGASFENAQALSLGEEAGEGTTVPEMPSNASDILKDLEALKREVDEARKGAGG